MVPAQSLAYSRYHDRPRGGGIPPGTLGAVATCSPASSHGRERPGLICRPGAVSWKAIWSGFGNRLDMRD